MTTHALQGDPADASLGVAENSDAAIIVVDGKGMHSADRERFGNVADKLSHDGSASVLIVFAGEAGDGDPEAMSAVAAADASSSGDGEAT